MTIRGASLLLLLLISRASFSQSSGISIPAGTPLPVKIAESLPMKAGEPVSAELLYPVYSGDQLVLPAKTVVTGSVVSLRADRTRRIHARLRADFTPFHIPAVEFDTIHLADGSSVPLTTGTATDGAPIYRLVAPPARKGSAISKGVAAFGQGIKDRISFLTAPDKEERFKQFLWDQLPYHPESIAKNTAWTVETAAPVTMPSMDRTGDTALAGVVAPPDASEAPRTWMPQIWIVQAYLNTPISSAHSKAGETIQATVAEPIVNPDGSVAVPVGSILSGSVTEAKAARSFARAGVLRFSFRDLKIPGDEPVAVQAALTGADSAIGGNLEMNSEGEVKPKPQDKIIVPLILLALARSPLRHHRHGEGGSDALASNSLGLIGFVVGVAARQPSLAAGIGFYGAAISIYERIFRTGKEIAFARDTRIVLQTTARRSAAMKPAGSGGP